MSGMKKVSADNYDWTDLPLHTLIYEWMTRNKNLPTDLGTIVAYIGLFLIIWLAIVWLTRFVLSIIWPLFFIATAIIVFRILQFYEPEEIVDMVKKFVIVVADSVVMLMAKSLELCLKIFNS